MLSPADELAFETTASPFYFHSFVSPSALVQTQTVDAPSPPSVRRTTRSTNKKRHLDSADDSESENDDNGSDYAPPSSKKRKTQSGPPPFSAPPIPAPPIFIMDQPGQKGYGSPAYASALRPPRGKALLPTPIPNLTKKSRGRRVPTADDDPHDKRMYACPAVGCGKCFHRGEHLKRHIRSIHTNDKPFRCEEHGCGKYFNRHDNLLQHLKVHSLTDSGQLPMPISRPSKRKDSLPPPPSSDTGLRLCNALAYQPSFQASSSNTDGSTSPSTSSQVSHAEMAVSATRTELPSGEIPLDPALPDDLPSEQQHQHHHQQFPPFYSPQFDSHQHPPYFSSDAAHIVPPESLDEQLWNY